MNSPQEIRYARPEYDISAMDSHWADSQMVRLIGRNKNVLEIGCASGHFGKYLKQKSDCKVWAVELDPRLVEIARPHYEKIVAGNVSEEKTFDSFQKKFDVILCSNVLEHLVEPGQTLLYLKKQLNPDGYFVIALPNIAHWSIRAGLMMGNFRYTESGGILDKGHLKFFTYRSACELLGNAGLKIDYWSFDWDNGIPKLNGLLMRVPRLGPWLLEKLYSIRPTFFGYQFIFKASNLLKNR